MRGKRVNVKPKPYSVEASIAWIVVSTFWISLSWSEIRVAHDHGRAADWAKGVQLVFWLGILAFAVWSGTESGRRNHTERIQREKSLD